MNDFNSIFFALLYLFIGAMFLRGIYKTTFMRLNSPQDYIKKAYYLTNYYRMRSLSTKTLEDALRVFPTMSEEERSFIEFQIGVNYHKKRKLDLAIQHYEKAWPFLKKAKIPFSKVYASIVVAYYDVGEKEKAREIYHFLMQKEKYDPRFAALSYLESSIFK